jgi:hypothetical protein
MQDISLLKINLRKALFISVIAAVIIEAILLAIALNILNYVNLFTLPYIFILFFLAILAILAYNFFIKGLNHSRRIATVLIPIGISLALIGVLLSLLGLSYGIFLLMFAYLIELITGYFMRVDFNLYSSKGTKIFLVGLFIYVLSLFLFLYNIYLIIIPIFGNLLKGVGLFVLYKSLFS